MKETRFFWVRTLPHVHRVGSEVRLGVVVLGVHTPEFAFEHDVDNVCRALQQMRVTYPSRSTTTTQSGWLSTITIVRSGIWTLSASLLVPQQNHGIYSRGSARRDIRGEEADEPKHNDYGDEGRCIRRSIVDHEA